MKEPQGIRVAMTRFFISQDCTGQVKDWVLCFDEQQPLCCACICVGKRMTGLSDIWFEVNRITKEGHRAVRYVMLESCHNGFSASLHSKKCNDCTD
jgi:hypothetical protein